MRLALGKIIKYTLSLILAGILLYFALRGIDLAAFADGLRQTRWAYVLLFILFSIFALILRTMRWKALLQALDPSVRSILVWDASNVGNFANVALPGAGELVRCAYVSSKSGSYDKILGTILCERAWDMVAIVLTALIAILVKWDIFGAFFIEQILSPLGTVSIWWPLIGLGIVAALYIFLVFRFRGRIKFCEKNARAISNLLEGLTSIVRIRKKGLFILYTLAIWLIYALMCFFIFRSLPPLSHLNFIDALFISSLGSIASVVPVPGGIGAYHYLFTLSLSSIYGSTWEIGLLAATLNHELHAILVIALGLVSYLRLSVKR